MPYHTKACEVQFTLGVHVHVFAGCAWLVKHLIMYEIVGSVGVHICSWFSAGLVKIIYWLFITHGLELKVHVNATH